MFQAEKESIKEEERLAEELYFKYGKKELEDADKKFFLYGEEVYNLAKDNGRQTMPVERVVEVRKLKI